LEWPGEFQITSAPVIVRDNVIVGSAIADNRRAEGPSGMVRAFDARTGRPRWSFDPLLHHSGVVAGHANVWAPMSVDEERGLVFLPTSSPSPDFWGGKRPGNNDYANSVVALRAESGLVGFSIRARFDNFTCDAVQSAVIRRSAGFDAVFVCTGVRISFAPVRRKHAGAVFS